MNQKNTKKTTPLPMAMQKRILEATYDLDREAEQNLDALEVAVQSGRVSLRFALARAFGDGASYAQKARLVAEKRRALEAT